MSALSKDDKLQLLTTILESRHGDLREQNLNRQGKMGQWENARQGGAATGMKLMDMAIQALLDSKQISGMEAFKKSINKSRFENGRDAS